MIKQSTPRPLFIFEMANNHMGSVDHGLRIIREVHEVTRDFDFDFAFKFQFRQLDTFIHPAYRDRSDVKYVKRFSETRLSPDEFRRLKDELDRLGFVSICTPFDEPSVDLIEEMGFDYLKVASCSVTDWPLLERIAASSKPVIASAAGAPLAEIDKVVSFFEHRSRPLALMHCVAAYPTPSAKLELNQIDLFRGRYPSVRIGYSTHEAPERTDAVQLAVAKGATIFEKHVGVPTDAWPLNAYSASPAQVRRWLEAAREALEMCGVAGERSRFTEDEVTSLAALRRGAFARRPIAAGERIDPADLLLAIPSAPGQVTANDLSKYSLLYAEADIPALAAITAENTRCENIRETVYGIVQRVRGLISESRVVVPGKMDLEISHHYGIDRFDEYGATMVTCVNREYCKKLIVLVPGQTHPEQYHRVKEETFLVLHGQVRVGIDGEVRECGRGDVVTVERGKRHWFSSETGAVIEEISSTHHVGDSYYLDPVINENPSRKTLLTHWLS